MINNDILRSVRFILNVNEHQLLEILKLDYDSQIDIKDIASYLKKEDQDGFKECPELIMAHFLNALIYYKRGIQKDKPKLIPDEPTNNVVLKKLRVAFELKDTDIIELLKTVGLNFSKSEVNALFRNEDHPNFRQCGDQLLRNFLKALSLKHRPEAIKPIQSS